MYKRIFILESQHHFNSQNVEVNQASSESDFFRRWIFLARVSIYFLPLSFHSVIRLFPAQIHRFTHVFIPPEYFIFWDTTHFVVKCRNHWTKFYRLWMLARWCRAYKQQVWERNAAISISVEGTAKTATPSITSVTVDIFETEIIEFYVLMQSTRIFNK